MANTTPLLVLFCACVRDMLTHMIHVGTSSEDTRHRIFTIGGYNGRLHSALPQVPSWFSWRCMIKRKSK